MSTSHYGLRQRHNSPHCLLSQRKWVNARSEVVIFADGAWAVEDRLDPTFEPPWPTQPVPGTRGTVYMLPMTENAARFVERVNEISVMSPDWSIIDTIASPNCQSDIGLELLEATHEAKERSAAWANPTRRRSASCQSKAASRGRQSARSPAAKRTTPRSRTTARKSSTKDQDDQVGAASPTVLGSSPRSARAVTQASLNVALRRTPHALRIRV